MYRYTYLGYACGKNVSVAESEQVYFSLVGNFDHMTFIYLETPVRDLDPDAAPSQRNADLTFVRAPAQHGWSRFFTAMIGTTMQS